MNQFQPNMNEFAAARSWTIDREAAHQSSKRLAWIIAGVATLVAVVEAFALASLAPLKSVAPFTILVDRHTGHVESLDPLKPQHIKGETALTQSLLAQYVAAREGFDFATIKANYRKVGLWSAEGAQRDYLALLNPSNPEGPITTLGRSSTLTTAIKSVSPLSENTAMVRFDTFRSDSQGPLNYDGSWVALLTYRFTGAPMALPDRLINPLGFQVVSYRSDVEIPRRSNDLGGALVPKSGAPQGADMARKSVLAGEIRKQQEQQEVIP